MPSHGGRAVYVFILNLMLFCVWRRRACLGTVPVPTHICVVCPHCICLSHCFKVHMSLEFFPYQGPVYAANVARRFWILELEKCIHILDVC